MDRDVLLRLYEMMARLRAFEMKVHDLCEQGVLKGCHLYVGQEASAVGVCAHLGPNDWAISNHRGHGHALAKGVPSKILMAELFGKSTGCSSGRGGSQHLYYRPAGFLCSNGFIAGAVPHAVGFALSSKVRGAEEVAVAFLGDGATAHGAFHESINFASAQRAPVVFVCENNGVATETLFRNATGNTNVASKAAAYGVPGIRVDGNDIVAVWHAMKEATDRARSGGGPTLIENVTSRWMAHNEGGPVCGRTRYRTMEDVQRWMDHCPIAFLRDRIAGDWHVTTDDELDRIDSAMDEETEEAVRYAFDSPAPERATLHRNVFAVPLNPNMAPAPEHPEMVRRTWVQAVADGIAEEMRRDPHIMYFGEGTGERGGCWNQTVGLWQEFGPLRLIDTPISELGFTGSAVGASVKGSRTVADLMFASFMFDAATQVVNQAAKLRYMSDGQYPVPVVIRAAMGYVPGAVSSHGSACHSTWAHIPGLVVVVPSNPADAKGLMKTALRCSDPVVFLDPAALVGLEGDVPVGEDILVPFGKARIAREGADLTVITCGAMLHRSLNAASRLETAQGISCEVIDLRTIVPLDVECIVDSVRKTGRVLAVDEDWAMCGVGGEIAAVVMEHAFSSLKAPVGRLHVEAVTHPFAACMDDANLPTVDKIIDFAKSVVDGAPLIQKRAGLD